MNILNSSEVVTQDKTALFKHAKDVCFGQQLKDIGGFSIGCSYSAGRLTEWREGKDIEMFVSMSSLSHGQKFLLCLRFLS